MSLHCDVTHRCLATMRKYRGGHSRSSVCCLLDSCSSSCVTLLVFSGKQAACERINSAVIGCVELLKPRLTFYGVCRCDMQILNEVLCFCGVGGFSYFGYSGGYDCRYSNLFSIFY